MKKVIIFNGPPRCGKDTAANYLKEKLGSRAKIVSFKEPLIELTARFYGMTKDVFLLGYDDQIIDGLWRKDQPSSMLNGKSQRGALIHVSENVVKPVFGDSVFGDALKHTIASDEDHDVFLVPDSGFEAELQPLRTLFDVSIVPLSRTNCSFAGDSRDYVKADYPIIANNGTIQDFLSCIDLLSLNEGLLYANRN